MPDRRPTRQVMVGKVPIGGDSPISVQSMTTTVTSDVAATVSQVLALARAGAEIVRLAVADMASAEAIEEIKREVAVPLVADIHYDHRLALASLEAGVDKLRLNPGNIRDPDKIKQVAEVAGERGVPIRIGVNAGSLDARFLKRGEVTPEGMVEAALWEVSLLEAVGFSDIVISLKAHQVPLTVEANRLLAKEGDWPLHLGITEPGPGLPGTVRSAVGLGILLAEGIGDTIRVSLPGDPVREVEVAWEILKSLELRQRGIVIVACPTCGRATIDVEGISEEIRTRLSHITRPLSIAIMGCPVNGIGEAGRADYGILGGFRYGTIYAHGKVAIPKVPADRLADELVALVEREVGEE